MPKVKFNLSIDEDLKKEFLKLMIDENKKASEVIAKFMEEYINKRESR